MISVFSVLTQILILSGHLLLNRAGLAHFCSLRDSTGNLRPSEIPLVVSPHLVHSDASHVLASEQWEPFLWEGHKRRLTSKGAQSLHATSTLDSAGQMLSLFSPSRCYDLFVLTFCQCLGSLSFLCYISDGKPFRGQGYKL